MKILLALDQSTSAMSAARFLRAFPVPSGSSVCLLHVTETPMPTGSSRAYDIGELQQQIATIRVNRRETGRAYLSRVQRLYRGQGLTVRQIVKEGIPGAEIVKCIEKEEVDLVVMGTRGLSNLKRFVLGSVSEWVLADAPCSVLIVREQRRRGTPRRKGMRFLLATDGSEDARAAAEFLQQLKPPSGSLLTLVHVADNYHDHVVSRIVAPGRQELTMLAKDLLRFRQERGAKLLGETSHEFRSRGWRVRESLLVGHPADRIVKTCTQVRPDLTVLGSRGLTGLRRFLLGSVSHKVARNAPSSILVVRRPARADSASI